MTKKQRLTSEDAIPVERLRRGECGIVTELRGADDEICRLAELGIREGVELACLQRGQPCIIRCGQARMCLRTAGDLQVLVTRLAG